MNSRKISLFVGVVFLSVCCFAFADGIAEPNKPNLNNDGRVDFNDFAIFANNWQQTGIGLSGDFDDSNIVDINDLVQFCWY